ncbi:MAG: chalcone isomerase family protein [Deltaproteobacteria bacterium]|nr:chalcone isomerase family protein [Deltaproteobacteria bacterium]
MAYRHGLVIGLLVACVASGSLAWAGECQGVRVPDALEVGGERLVLNGLGLREATVFKINVYVAALYLKEKSDDGEAIAGADQSKLMRLSFLRGVSKADMRKTITEGVKKSSPEEWTTLQARVQQFFEMLPAFEPGETLTLWYVPGKGVQVKAPGQGSGVIEGLDFARALFRVWLGEPPTSVGLKKGLLGGRCG